jgi:hypothetical protein
MYGIVTHCGLLDILRIVRYRIYGLDIMLGKTIKGIGQGLIVNMIVYGTLL